MTATPARAAPFRRYLPVVLVGWLALGWGAWEYARIKMVPQWAAGPITTAFLIEFPFYLLPGFAAARERVSKALGRVRLAVTMAASAVLPYLVYSVPTGVFHAAGLALLLFIAAAIALWYIALPESALRDALFLALLATVVFSKIFTRIYLDPLPGLHMEYLGHVMLIRLAAMAILAIRGDAGVEFRFWPTAREWLAGARWFAAALPCAAAAYWALGLIAWRPHPLGFSLATGTFFATLWVVALSEEFFFRGLLQRWLEGWLDGWIRALVAASILFGAAHLGFARAFPNWRFSIVAGIAGIFYGLSWRETRAVQASMVTHALMVTAWRTFLR